MHHDYDYCFVNMQYIALNVFFIFKNGPAVNVKLLLLANLRLSADRLLSVEPGHGLPV